MVLFGPREIMRSRQLKAIAERSDSDISGRSADETLRYRESSGAMSDTAPRPPDEYEQVGWTCSTGPISQARIFVAQVKPGPPAGSMAWEPVYVRR